jgi:hypothetical protein
MIVPRPKPPGPYPNGRRVRKPGRAGLSKRERSRYPEGVRSVRARVAFTGWLLAAVPTAAGCRERATTSPGEQAESVAAVWPRAPTEGFVVLPWGTQVYLEPRFGGASARLGWASAVPPPWPSDGHVARVVGQRDGFVEIAPILAQPFSSTQGPMPVHCGPVLDGEVFDVRLYVSPWALATVLAREVEVRHDDGSALVLRPGAVAQPIPDDAQGRWAVSAGGIRVRAVLPDDAVALTYPDPLPQPIPQQRSWQLPEGRPFSYDGWPLEVVMGFGHDVAITAVTPNEGDHLVELWSACARVVAHSTQAPVSFQDPFSHHFPPVEFGLGAPDVVVPEEAPIELEVPAEGVTIDLEELKKLELPSEPHAIGGVVEAAAFGSGVLGVGPARPELVLEEGAPVYLSAAGPAAGALSELRVFGEESWSVGDRLCFHTSFGSRFDPPLPVCIDAAEGRPRSPATDMQDFSPWFVRPVSLRVDGAWSEAAVARALRRHRVDLRRCLGEAMQRGLRPSGGLELALDVDGRGGVLDVRPQSPAIEGFTGCAVAAARGWELPRTEDGKPGSVVLSVRLEPR